MKPEHTISRKNLINNLTLCSNHLKADEYHDKPSRQEQISVKIQKKLISENYFF